MPDLTSKVLSWKPQLEGSPFRPETCAAIQNLNAETPSPKPPTNLATQALGPSQLWPETFAKLLAFGIFNDSRAMAAVYGPT